jgi:hypothetical protein
MAQDQQMASRTKKIPEKEGFHLWGGSEKMEENT